ncbi:MAG TPA: response regulator [Opitutaceae bacterium]|nr:response regulator [Opitutaceae bacterium]
MDSPRPRNDADRLAALQAHHILDTPPEPEFDELARLAADICGVPIALITFVDRDRQWFKAKVGLETDETSREVSFCAHAICEPEREVFEIPDASADARFADNPLVTGAPHIRFYAGSPLVDGTGHALGTLCVIDRTPRTLTTAQRRGLAALRRFVVTSLELRRMVTRQRDSIGELETTRRALEATRQVAEEATRSKSQFLATMSHELRTPMNAVIGMTTLLRTTDLDSDQTEYVETIRSSGEVLLAVVNDILDLSKLDAGRVELDRTAFDLQRCIASAVDLLSTEARNKSLALHIEQADDAPRWITADAVRVRQIVLNLLSNAVKFTAHGEVVVRIAGRPRGDGQIEVEIVVADTGIGLSTEQIARLFREFGQADVSTTRRYGGTGLGLVISKRLAELHGGRMWVESTPGAGSQFHFTLVAAETSAPTTAPLPPDGTTLDPEFARQHPADILVAEDNPVNQRVITRLLQKLGYEVALAADGQEALTRLRQHPFDVVLMDVEMPELDGMDATRRLREELPPARQPVVIALSAHAFIDQRERFFEAGMDAYLAKPIRIGELTAELARASEKIRARTVPGH